MSTSPAQLTFSRRTHRAAGPPLPRWVMLCAAAEAVGMIAAAAAARASHAWVGGATDRTGVAVVLGLAIAGGLVEGSALGLAQARGLSMWLTHRRRTRWVLTTVAVAGTGWAVASAPAALAGDGGTQPPLPAIMAGAAAIGLTMGAGLGAAQAWHLRGLVRHPWRWVGANVVAWSLAMPAIFLGATTAGADWSVPSVLVWAAATGAVAGGLLGLVTGWFLPWVNGVPRREGIPNSTVGNPHLN